MRRSILVLSAALAAGLWLWTQPAAAYVRAYTADGCHPLFWAQTCVSVTTDAESVRDMPLSEVDRIVRNAVAGWQTRTRGQSFLDLVYVPAAGLRKTDVDGWNVIRFRDDTWCRPPDEPNGETICYDPAAVAITAVSYIEDGRILDADIELNATTHSFYDADQEPPPRPGKRRPTDLWTTLSHELGHLQGLEHSCLRGSTHASCLRDGAGRRVLDCQTVEGGRATNPKLEDIYETTMYPVAATTAFSKRAPKQDDVDGIVSTYPLDADPKICVVPSVAGQATNAIGACGAARPAPASASFAWCVLVALGLSTLLARRRRLRGARGK